MNREDPPAHALRGHRVKALEPSQIQNAASQLCRILNLKGNTFSKKNIGKLVATLEEHGINIDPIDEDEWHDLASAMADPQDGTIYMPEALFQDLFKVKSEAVRIFLHELGHILLMHRPLMRFSDTPVTQQEDSEWQADYFADWIIDNLGLRKHTDSQLELKI